MRGQALAAPEAAAALYFSYDGVAAISTFLLGLLEFPVFFRFFVVFVLFGTCSALFLYLLGMFHYFLGLPALS